MLYGRPCKEGRERQFLAAYLRHAIKQPHCQQRVSSQLEKVILDPDGPHLQQFLPDLHQLLLHWQPRRHVALFDHTPVLFGCGQRPPVYLAVG